MIYLILFFSYMFLLMGFILLSYVLWLRRSFTENPVGFTVRFKRMGRWVYGKVILDTGHDYLLSCTTGVRYRYVDKRVCKACFFRNFP